MNWHWDTEEIKAMIERGLKINGVKVTRSRNPNRQELDSCIVCDDLIPSGYTVRKGRKAWFVCSPGCGIDAVFENNNEGD